MSSSVHNVYIRTSQYRANNFEVIQLKPTNMITWSVSAGDLYRKGLISGKSGPIVLNIPVAPALHLTRAETSSVEHFSSKWLQTNTTILRITEIFNK